MSIYKCKICGGTLETNGIERIGKCDFCEKIQTLPVLTNNHIIFLYGRANHLRRSKRFDKAMPIYEQICSENPTDSESYWSLFLCRYGINYCMDQTSREITTVVNRVQPGSLFGDENYRLALNYANSEQKEIYRAEAEKIQEICGDILAIAERTEPYDVFIVSREKDSKNRTTQDSQTAQELCDWLTEEGLKVFYPALSLMGKSENESAAHRYTALHSAKVMAVIGTRREYFNDAEVRNDWSAYLELMKYDKGKTIISAYMEMSKKDLPEEIGRMKSFDMAEIGFMRDIICEIKSGTKSLAEKIAYITYDEQEFDVIEILSEAFSFLENGEFDNAEQRIDEVLKVDEQNAEAYLGKLMIENKAKTSAELKNCDMPFFKSVYYQKIMKYGSDMLKTELQGYIEYINQRNMDNVLERKYRIAYKLYSEGKFNRASIVKARTMFELLADYKDSPSLVQECRELIRIIDKNKQYELALTFFEESDRLFQRAIDENSLSLLENAIDKIREAESKFIIINDSREYDDMIDKCRAKEKKYQSAGGEIEQHIILQKQNEKKQQERARLKKIMLGILVVVGIVTAWVMLLNR